MNLRYETELVRNDLPPTENAVYAVANRQQYRVKNELTKESYYGLISRNGERITPPIYTEIEAIGKNRYLCQPQRVIIDDDGKVVN